MAGRVYVFGSINTDLVTYIERMPVPGETVSGGRFATYPGGKGANQAVAAALAGAEVHLFGCLGDDTFGRERLKQLAGAGIATEGIQIRGGVHSGLAQIFVDAAGENMIAVAPGANMYFDPDQVDLPQMPEAEGGVALFQNEIPQAATERLITECARRGFRVIWNIAPPGGDPPARETLQAVELLVCNRTELSFWAGEKGGEEEQAHRLLDWGLKEVLVTLGYRGSLLVSRTGLIRQGAFQVEAVDTVGAGDCYCGVLAAGFAAGLPIEKSLRLAAAGAALSVTRHGAQTSMPAAREIEEFLAGRDGG